MLRIKPPTYSDDPIPKYVGYDPDPIRTAKRSLIPTKQIARNNRCTVADVKHSRNVSRKLVLNRSPLLINCNYRVVLKILQLVGNQMFPRPLKLFKVS